MSFQHVQHLTNRVESWGQFLLFFFVSTLLLKEAQNVEHGSKIYLALTGRKESLYNHPARIILSFNFELKTFKDRVYNSSWSNCESCALEFKWPFPSVLLDKLFVFDSHIKQETQTCITNCHLFRNLMCSFSPSTWALWPVLSMR